jgi:hypothetical protein
MKTNLDLRSALFGLIAGVLLMFTLGATQNLIGPTERFQVAGTASHGLVIDTTTGQVWSSYLPQNGGKTDAGFFAPKLTYRSVTPPTPLQ